MSEADHAPVSSEGDDPGVDNPANPVQPGPDTSGPPDSDALDAAVSSEGSLPTGGDASEADDDLLVEDGYMMATHGGGTLEEVPGFDSGPALTEGFTSTYAEVPEELEQLPMSCQLEYDFAETVCGRDDRARMRSTARIPWRLICQLVITRHDGGKSLCTGWFIGPRTVMTAGHCVYSHSAGGWARQIEVIPGIDATSRPFGSQVGRSFRSVRGWTQSGSSNYDYGAIILPDNTLGNKVGWFGFASLSSGSLDHLLVNNAGYAGDKSFGTLWYNAGRVTQIENRRLFYMIDTYGGQSGSPVWRYRNGQRHVIGVHAYGGCPNKATRITSGVFKNMKTWKDLGF